MGVLVVRVLFIYSVFVLFVLRSFMYNYFYSLYLFCFRRTTATEETTQSQLVVLAAITTTTTTIIIIIIIIINSRA